MLMVGASLLLVATGPVMAQDNVLSVIRTQETIVIDGKADEASWGTAIMSTIETDKGGTIIDVEVKALYDEEFIYLLAKWPDQSKSVMPQQWQLTGGTWFSAPHKEDRLSFLWNTDDAIIGFENQAQGCAALNCHADGWETRTSEEVGDLWQWMAGKTNPSASVPDVGWMDDLSVDNTGIVPDDFTGSKVWERNSVYDHDGNESTLPFTEGDLPMWMKGSSPPNPDPEGLYLFRGFETDIVDPQEFADGTNLPGYLLSRPSDGKNRADISAKGVYDDALKTWTLEIKRKLVTGNAADVAFDNILDSYYFGLAVFDNQGGGMNTHYNSDLVTLRFDVPELNILSVTAERTAPIYGTSLNVTTRIKNVGGYSTGFTVAMYLDNLTTDAVGTHPYTEMTSGLEDTFNFSLSTTGLSIGKHTVYVKVDAAEIISEHDEANNVKMVDIWVFPPIKEFKTSKKTPEEGSKITLTAVIENPSSDDANVTVVFYEGDTVLRSMPANISAGATYEAKYEWKATKTGKHTFRVEVEGTIDASMELQVDVKSKSPGPSLFIAALALALAAGMSVSRRRRN
jgi:hypothetical protein